MHRLKSKVSGWIPLFGITAALSLWGTSGFAQDEGEPGDEGAERKTVSITAHVSSPPPGITITEALQNFPEKVGFEYQYAQRKFTTDTKPFAVERTLSQEYNVTIQANDGLKHEDEENVQQVLIPVLKVGDTAAITNNNDMAKWCGAGETPAAITFDIQDSDTVPAEGNFTGEMILVFEPASEG